MSGDRKKLGEAQRRRGFKAGYHRAKTEIKVRWNRHRTELDNAHQDIKALEQERDALQVKLMGVPEA